MSNNSGITNLQTSTETTVLSSPGHVDSPMTDLEPSTASCPAPYQPQNDSLGAVDVTKSLFTTGNLFSKNVDAVLRENERLKKQLLHVESLGRLVADCKQNNIHLSKENTDLRERLDQFLQMQSRNPSWNMQAIHSLDSTSSEPVNADVSKNRSTLDEYSSDEDDPEETFEVVNSEDSAILENACSSSITCAMTVFPTTQDFPSKLTEAKSRDDATEHSIPGNNSRLKTQTNSTTSEKNNTSQPPAQGINSMSEDRNMSNNRTSIDDEETRSHSIAMEATAAAAFCERQAHVQDTTPSLTEEINVFNEVLKSDNQVSQFEIRQLEGMVGLTNISNGSELDEHLNASLDSDRENSGSVTAQFAKLATVFARLAQRVMQTQKKARNSQAFCDSLMRENDKMKMQLNMETKKVSTLRREIEEKDEVMKRLSKDSTRPQVRRSCSLTEETHVKESADNYPSDAFANINDPRAQSEIVKLQNRVKKLEGQRTEILTVNKQWHAQYNKLKDESSAKLSACKTEMEELREQITGKQRESAKRRKDIDILLREAKKEIEILQRQKGDLAKSYAMEHSKIKKMNEKVEKLKSDLSCIEAENQRLNQALEAAYSIRQNRLLSVTNSLFDIQVSDPTDPHNNTSAIRPLGHLDVQSGEEMPDAVVEQQAQVIETASGQVEDLKTRIEVLQQQVKIYREDFETERRDREKSQAEKQRLAEEMTRMRDEMRALTQQVRAHEQDFRQERREKQRLQRQLSRIQSGGELYYGVEVPDAFEANNHFQRRHTSPTRERDRHRFRQPTDRTGMGDILLQTNGTSGDTTRRYPGRTRTSQPPPYTQDTTRHRRRPAPTTRRIHDGYLEPTGYEHDPDVVYPPGNILNQF